MDNRFNISFIIPTAGSRPKSLTALCDSIGKSVPDPKEIIIVGNISSPPKSADITIDMKEEAAGGKICKLRNEAAGRAKGNILVLFDDDVALADNWYENMMPLFYAIDSEQAHIGTCRVVGPNGKRWYDWSWASRSDPECPSFLLPYFRRHENLYVSGCCMIISRSVWDAIRFDELRLNHQHDDVDFCHRAIDAGFKFRFCRNAVVTHLMLPAGRNPEDPASGTDAFAEVIHRYRNGKVAVALESLQGLRSEIDAARFNYYSGLFHFCLRNFTRATASFEAALQSLDTNIDRALAAMAYYRLGLIYNILKKNNLALEKYDNVLGIMPDHPFARLRIRLLNGEPAGLP